ncbi:alpha/beta hydrolase [Aestuariivirga sp. YIM B02566]|uniref:Uncharacterized protein n=1 Tax=Taklimakanibacter albus TaxID=2800327 RepID=A0ACC5R0J8_9HYPH|nr:hypothetical protein [Aestuariivirga sp. YIM B02566]MBK1866179.1 hypothetical protein [Aestuariivirga sp. YIM B02566]
MIRQLIRLVIVVAGAKLLALASAPAYAIDPQAGLDAEVIYRTEYPGLKRHKAMAIGPGGVWGNSYGYGSAAEAEKNAIKTCRAALRPKSWGKSATCKLLARGNKFVWSTPFMGASFDKALPLPDVPLRGAVRFWPKDPKLKGIVLALHGCSGPGNGVDAFVDSWFRFFQARGFLVIYPSSFDEQRPPSYCGWIAPENYRAFTEAVKFRAAQTRRTIAELRKSHPDLPLYIWAHSEGGYVAQVLDTKLSGIIIVGTVCGISRPGAMLVPRSVPILHVYGELDDKVIDGTKTMTRKYVDKLCGPRYRGKGRSWVIADDADHLTSIWRQNVIDAVSRMIGQKSFGLAESKEPLSLEGEARVAYEKSYLHIGKTAFAIGPGGAYCIAASWSNTEDTKQDALYQCARAVDFISQDAPYPPGGRQPCRLYAIGIKPVTP